MAGVAVLLGAGASVDAGLPNTGQMIDSLLSDFQQQSENERINQPIRPLLRLLEFIVHGLRQEAAVRDNRKNPAGVDVETMFEAIETLANRTRLSIAPFIASWHPLVSEAERSVAAARDYESPQRRVSRLLADAIHKGAGQVMSPFSSTTFETDRLARELLGSGDKVGSAFGDLADAVLQALVRVLQLKDTGLVGYLEPLMTLYRDQGGLDIATLNYDLTIETLGALSNEEVDTGMDQWHVKPAVSFTRPLRLLKLHGSIDWQSKRREPATSDDALLPFEGVERVPGQIPEKPSLIFGAGNKLRAGGPYLELLRQFEDALNRSRALLVVGYSFRDEHVNALVTNWLNLGLARRIVVLDPAVSHFGGHGFYVPPEERTIRLELAQLAQRRTDLVKLVPMTAASGLPTAIEAASGSSSTEGAC
jgi:hypothetical protein